VNKITNEQRTHNSSIKKLFPYDTREIFISFTKDHYKKYITINYENRCSKQKRYFPLSSEFLFRDFDKRFDNNAEELLDSVCCRFLETQ